MNFINLLSEVASSSGGGTQEPATFDFKTLLIMGVIVVLFIAWIYMGNRNRRKQQQAIEEKMGTLAIGDKITTIGMICGTVAEICDDGSVVLKTGTDSHPGFIRIDKQGIYRFNKAESVSDEPFAEISENKTGLPAVPEGASEAEIDAEIKKETAEDIELEQAELQSEDIITN